MDDHSRKCFQTDIQSADELEQQLSQVWCKLDYTAFDQWCKNLEHALVRKLPISSTPCELTHSNRIIVLCD